MKTAKVYRMQSGDYQVFVSDKEGTEYRAILSEDGNLVLSDHTNILAVLYLSDKALSKIEALETEASNKAWCCI